MDGITLYCIRKEVDGYLPLKVQKVYQPRTREVVFSLWGGQGFRSRLLLSIEPQRPYFGFTSEDLDNPKKPLGFCLGLRKRLEGGTLTGLDQESSDRVLYLRFLGRDDFGDRTLFTLVMDMAGKGANMGLYRNEVLVLSLLPPDGTRFVAGGGYTPPHSSKLDILQEPLPADFRHTLAVTLLSESATSLRTLSSTVQGLGNDLAESILRSVSVDPESAFSEQGVQDTIHALYALRDRVRNGLISPTLYEKTSGDVWVHALPLFHKTPVKTYDTILDAMEDSRLLTVEKRRLEALRSRGTVLYDRVLRKLESKMRAQSQELEEAKDAQKYRLWAELIDASGKKHPPGQREMEVIDYYKDPPTTAIVPLDPKYSSGDNARKYYARYQKMTRTARVLTSSLAELRSKLIEAQAAGRAFCQVGQRDLVEMSRALAALEKIAAGAGITVRSHLRADEIRNVSGSRDSHETPSKYGLPHGIRSLEGPQGSRIFVGTTARANDYLATKFRQPGDIWFHAKGVRGAHVLLRPAFARQVPQEAIDAAAKIAAEVSDARASGRVEVDWAEASKVKKPRGAAPGFVTYTGQRTMLVALHHASPISDERSDRP
ncbi:MAG: Rqc2 family fibronectin-binding protein [Bacillota bacterium]